MFAVVFREISKGDPGVRIRVVDAFSESPVVLCDVLGKPAHDCSVHDVQVHDGGVGLFDGSDQVHVSQGSLDVGFVVTPTIESTQVGVLVQGPGVEAGLGEYISLWDMKLVLGCGPDFVVSFDESFFVEVVEVSFSVWDVWVCPSGEVNSFQGIQVDVLDRGPGGDKEAFSIGDVIDDAFIGVQIVKELLDFLTVDFLVFKAVEGHQILFPLLEVLADAFFPAGNLTFSGGDTVLQIVDVLLLF